MVLLAGGIIFAVLPPLPGPIISFLGLLCVHYSTEEASFSMGSLIFWAILVTIIMVADYTLPVMATKKFGGTKSGIWGGIIGTIVGVIAPIPFGIVLGPLFGAVIGDLVGGNHFKAAMKSGMGSFLGFLLATSLKVVLCMAIGIAVVLKAGVYVFESLFQ